MRRPFRYVNEIAGAFVLLGLLLLAGGFMLAARSSGWFQSERRFAVTLPPEGGFGLRPGAEVRILGTVVGRVTDIGIDDAWNMRADVAIDADFGRFVRTDSVALVQKTYVVAGTAFLEITRGEGPLLPEGGTLGSMPFEALPKLLGDILGGIGLARDRVGAVIRAIHPFAATLGHDASQQLGPPTLPAGQGRSLWRRLLK